VEKRSFISGLNAVLLAGAVWGTTEALLGAWLNGCAFRYSGAIMTGLAFFYLSFTWSFTRKLLPLIMLLALVVLFKMFDAILLNVSLSHGSVLNPSFAFTTEVIAFAILALIIGSRFFSKPVFRILAGTGATLVAVCMFPAAGLFTGSAVCLYPGTQLPLSIATSPLTIAISVITVPLGYFVAEKISSPSSELKNITPIASLRQIWPSMVMVLCLVVLILIRTIWVILTFPEIFLKNGNYRE
jgi:hypothetical protein